MLKNDEGGIAVAFFCIAFCTTRQHVAEGLMVRHCYDFTPYFHFLSYLIPPIPFLNTSFYSCTLLLYVTSFVLFLCTQLESLGI